MPNQQLNPFTAPLSVIKQIGEQANASIQAVGTSMTQAASGTLDAFMSGLPPFPGTPTPAPAPAAQGRSPGIPALQQLMPANLQQAMSQVENLLIPPGLPRLSQMVTGLPAPAPAPPPAAPPAAPPNAQAVAARRRVQERRGM